MQAVHNGKIPPTADVDSPNWYAEIDPTVTKSLPVQITVGAQRAHSLTWQLQFGLGPQPLDSAFTTFATGSASGKQLRTINKSLDLTQIPSSFWSGNYTAPTADRLAIEQYDVTLRVVVTDNNGLIGEDRRVFHLRHHETELAGFPLSFGTSLEAGASMADLEGRGLLDTIVAGSDDSVHAIRPDGDEAPGFPVTTNLARGVDRSYPFNYLKSLAWKSEEIPLPHDPIESPLSVGDLDHDGALDIVATTADGFAYVWDGRGKTTPGTSGVLRPQRREAVGASA